MASQRPEADAAHWRALFLDMLRKTGNLSAAARHAGRARAQLYRLRKQDTAFAALWDDALEEAANCPHGQLISPGDCAVNSGGARQI